MSGSLDASPTVSNERLASTRQEAAGWRHGAWGDFGRGQGTQGWGPPAWRWSRSWSKIDCSEKCVWRGGLS